MYAHEVITDFMRYYDHPLYDEAIFLREAFRLFDNLPNAQQFHAGEYHQLEKVMSRESKGGTLFWDYKDYLKMPYKLCWIEYYFKPFIGPPQAGKYDAPRRGMLAEELMDGVIHILTVHYAHDKWNLSPIAFFVSLQKRFKEIKNISNLLMNKYNHYTPMIKALNLDRLNQQIATIPLSPKVVAFINEYGWEKLMVSEVLTDLQALEFFLLLLNCKNVSTEAIVPTNRINKKRRKRGEVELFTYHVLKFKVPSSKRASTNSGEPQSHKRIHFCRGHFKEYTAENPLFGKHVGLYWWPAHVKGQNREGIVLKDYELQVSDGGRHENQR